MLVDKQSELMSDLLFTVHQHSGIDVTWKTTYMFINSISFPKNHNQFQTKMGKIYTQFSDRNSAKTLPFGAAHAYMAYIREYLRG